MSLFSRWQWIHPLRTRCWWYSPVFAVVNFLEALVELLFLGFCSPGWVMEFAKWYTLRDLRKRQQ